MVNRAPSLPWEVDSGSLRYCREIIDSACGLVELYPPIQTAAHLVVPAQTERFGSIALKIGLRRLAQRRAGTREGAAIPPLSEIAALRKLADHPEFSLPVLVCADDHSWFIRQWTSGEVLSEIEGFAWNKTTVVELWKLFEKIFEIFHDAAEPWLIRDIKPSNVLYGSGKFSLFDFSTTRPLSEVNSRNRRDRLGSRAGRSWGPELLFQGKDPIGVNADYFSLATMLYQLLRRERGPVWQNETPGQEQAVAAYAVEYEKVRKKFPKSLKEVGMSGTQIDFWVACMNPDQGQRPDQFLSLNGGRFGSLASLWGRRY
ncbi:serine/threonine-protein kinase [Octadecabacter sp. SW4]|uniref:protein kinase domain-containing protein n=1 Tax=Octadecabacter sp. SW4 TaxID=2602067 RepID=UPI00155A1841|nr:serine/threonine-protein kinase [Octadecabacter sp. SW4]